MSQRSSGIFWLVIALLCGFLSLLSCGGIGYTIYHVETNLQSLENQIKEDEKERMNPKVTPNKLKEIEVRLAGNDKEEHEYKRYRWFGIAGAVLGLVPPFMTFGALLMAFMKFRAKPDEDDDEEEGDDDKNPDDADAPSGDDE